MKNNSLYNKYKQKLWCDLKNDREKMEFIQCGRAHETGIIAKALEHDIVKLLEEKLEQNAHKKTLLRRLLGGNK